MYLRGGDEKVAYHHNMAAIVHGSLSDSAIRVRSATDANANADADTCRLLIA